MNLSANGIPDEESPDDLLYLYGEDGVTVINIFPRRKRGWCTPLPGAETAWSVKDAKGRLIDGHTPPVLPDMETYARTK